LYDGSVSCHKCEMYYREGIISEIRTHNADLENNIFWKKLTAGKEENDFISWYYYRDNVYTIDEWERVIKLKAFL
jgi:hypothetical protein